MLFKRIAMDIDRSAYALPHGQPAHTIRKGLQGDASHEGFESTSQRLNVSYPEKRCPSHSATI